MISSLKIICGMTLPVLLLAGCAVNQENSSPSQSAQMSNAGNTALRASQVSQPAGWDEDLAMAIPVDINPDPDILEINLEAKITDMEIIEGKITPVWTYGGSLPGPMIRAKVGDRLIIHFSNNLPDSTSIHWHGVRVPNNMDGVPGVTQDPVPAGGKFTYDFVLRDAGTYWYHPHINSAAQVGWGMYGALVVEDPADPEEFGDELVLVFSDMSLDEEGQFLPSDTGGAFSDLFGREGGVILVNGTVKPSLKVRKGKQQRWRVINAARTRYYTIRHNRQPFIRLGGDNGLAERSETLDQIKLVPSERTDFVFTPQDEPGTVDWLKWYPTERGYGSTFNRFSEEMMEVVTVNEPEVLPESIPTELRHIEQIDVTGAKELLIDLTIVFPDDNTVEMGINGIPYWNSKPLEAQIGETHVWTVRNDTDFNHPFHLHGYFFQVLDEERIPEWKDSVDIPVHTELKLAVSFDERPGTWMYHCHILDHAEVGMMGTLRVSP